MHTTSTTVGDTLELELALLRRGLDDAEAATERCDACHRSMLIGERVYEYESMAVRCELCRDVSRVDPIGSHTIHGPAFGHSIRVIDRRGVLRSA